MHQDVQSAPLRTDAIEYGLQLPWHRDVKRPGDRRRKFLRQRLHMGARPFVEPSDCQFCAHSVERLRAAIGNRLIVGHADHECFSPGKHRSDTGIAHLGLP